MKQKSDWVATFTILDVSGSITSSQWRRLATYRSTILIAVLGVVLALAAACDRADAVVPPNAPAPTATAPTAVACADAAQLEQRARDERGKNFSATSDQEKVLAGSRATFYGSLAVAAGLKCKGTSAEADAALAQALDAARKAEEASTFYESAVQWTKAGVAANEAVSLLVGG